MVIDKVKMKARINVQKLYLVVVESAATPRSRS